MSDDDVIIIGTGAGGGTLAHRLAPSDKRILVLERGPFLRRELENWDSQEVVLNERYATPEKWLDKDGNEFGPHQQYFVRSSRHAVPPQRPRPRPHPTRRLNGSLRPYRPEPGPAAPARHPHLDQQQLAHYSTGANGPHFDRP
jgi:choline dehydrogenase-like flavoprotein